MANEYLAKKRDGSLDVPIYTRELGQIVRDFYPIVLSNLELDHISIDPNFFREDAYSGPISPNLDFIEILANLELFREIKSDQMFDHSLMALNLFIEKCPSLFKVEDLDLLEFSRYLNLYVECQDLRGFNVAAALGGDRMECLCRYASDLQAIEGYALFLTACNLNSKGFENFKILLDGGFCFEYTSGAMIQALNESTIETLTGLAKPKETRNALLIDGFSAASQVNWQSFL